MSTQPKKSGRPGGPESPHDAVAEPSPVLTKTPTSELKPKRPQTSDPKPRPAIKESARSRPGRPVSQTASKHKTVVGAPLSASAKKSISDSLSGAAKTPEAVTKGRITQAISTIKYQNREKTPHKGRQDPYDIPSDSEINDLPSRHSTSGPFRRSITSSSSKTGEPIGKNQRITRPSTPARVSVNLSTPVASSKTKHLIAGSHSSPRPRTSAQAPAHVSVIPADSLSDEISREVSGRPAVISLDESSKATHRQSASLGVSSHPRRIPAKIPANAEIISLAGSSSQSDEQEKVVPVSTPTRLSTRAIRKRSYHLVNGHLNIADEESQDATMVLPGTISIDENSNENLRVREKSDECNAGGSNHSPTRATETHKFDDGATSAKKKHEAREKSMKHARLNEKDQKTPSKQKNPSLAAGISSQRDESTRTAAEQETIVSEERASKLDRNPYLRDCDPKISTESVSGRSRVLTRPGDRTHGPTQTGQKVIKILNRSASGSESRNPSRAVDDGKKTRVRFEAEGSPSHIPSASWRHSAKQIVGRDSPVSESFLNEPDYSDDEYQPPSSNEERSTSESEIDQSFPQLFRIATPSHEDRDSESLQLSTGRKLRSASFPKPVAPFAPIRNLIPGMQEQEPAVKAPVESKLGQGNSQRVRDAFSDASKSSESESTTKRKQVVPTATPETALNFLRNVDEDPVAVPSVEPDRKPRWKPLEWIHKYETNFQGDKDGRLWFADGPFKGWIWSGPGAGNYMPGCKVPSDKMLAEAEKTAAPRQKYADWTDSESEELDNSEGTSHPNRGESHNDEGGIGESASGDCQYTATESNLEPQTSSSNMGISDNLAPPPDASLQLTQKPTSPAETEITRRPERLKAMEQHALDSTLSKAIQSQESNNIACSQKRGSFNLAPTGTADNTPSPLSTTSESSSILIARQLMNDCAPPPSNQELAELMSSSPAKRHDMESAAVKIRDGVDDSDGSYRSSSSSETSSGIPARVVHHTSLPPPAAPSSRNSSPRSLVYRSTSVASPGRQVRSPSLANMDAISSSPIPLQGSPIRPVRKQLNTTDMAAVASTDSKSRPPIKTNIVVELPALAVEKQAEYDTLSPSWEANDSSAPHPKSFKEINQATSSQGVQTHDSEAETLSYVLRQSPRWLNSITEVHEENDEAASKSKSSYDSRVKAPIQNSSLGSPEPAAGHRSGIASDNSPPRLLEVAPISASLWYRTTNEQQTSQPKSKRSSEDKGTKKSLGTRRREKREASPKNASVYQATISERMGTSNNRSRKDKKHGKESKKELRYIEERRQQRHQNNSTQPPVSRSVGVIRSVDTANKSAMSPPNSSRPSSSESKPGPKAIFEKKDAEDKEVSASKSSSLPSPVASSRKSPVDKPRPKSLFPGGTVLRGSPQKNSNTGPMSNRKMDERDLEPASHDNGIGDQHSGKKQREKRKASSTEFALPDDSIPSKRQKVNSSQPRKKDTAGGERPQTANLEQQHQDTRAQRTPDMNGTTLGQLPNTPLHKAKRKGSTARKRARHQLQGDST